MAIPTIHNDITFAQEVKDGKHNYMNVAGISKYLTKLHKYEAMIKNKVKENEVETFVDKQKLMWIIIEFLQNINKFNPESDYDIVKNTVRKYLRSNRPLIQNTNIKITTDELESIVALKNDHLETLAFGILVIQKINNLKFGKERNFFNLQLKDFYFEITKMARNKEKQNKALAALYEADWIDLPPIEKFGETDGFYLKCIDLDIQKENIEIETSDFREIHLIYKKWKSGRITSCEVCGRLIEITTSNNKYCEKCQKEKDKEKYIKYNKKRK